MNRLYFILLFICKLGYSQISEEQLNIYSCVFEHKLKSEPEYKIDSVVLVDQYNGRFRPSLDLLTDINKTITIQEVYQELYTPTYGDTTFLKRFLKDPDTRLAIKKLIDNFDTHPKFFFEDFENETANIYIISSQKFNSSLGQDIAE